MSRNLIEAAAAGSQSAYQTLIARAELQGAAAVAAIKAEIAFLGASSPTSPSTSTKMSSTSKTATKTKSSGSSRKKTIVERVSEALAAGTVAVDPRTSAVSEERVAAIRDESAILPLVQEGIASGAIEPDTRTGEVWYQAPPVELSEQAASVAEALNLSPLTVQGYLEVYGEYGIGESDVLSGLAARVAGLVDSGVVQPPAVTTRESDPLSPSPDSEPLSPSPDDDSSDDGSDYRDYLDDLMEALAGDGSSDPEDGSGTGGGAFSALLESLSGINWKTVGIGALVLFGLYYYLRRA